MAVFMRQNRKVIHSDRDYEPIMDSLQDPLNMSDQGLHEAAVAAQSTMVNMQLEYRYLEEEVFLLDKSFPSRSKISKAKAKAKARGKMKCRVKTKNPVRNALKNAPTQTTPSIPQRQNHDQHVTSIESQDPEQLNPPKDGRDPSKKRTRVAKDDLAINMKPEHTTTILTKREHRKRTDFYDGLVTSFENDIFAKPASIASSKKRKREGASEMVANPTDAPLAKRQRRDKAANGENSMRDTPTVPSSKTKPEGRNSDDAADNVDRSRDVSTISTLNPAANHGAREDITYSDDGVRNTSATSASQSSVKIGEYKDTTGVDSGSSIAPVERPARLAAKERDRGGAANVEHSAMETTAASSSTSAKTKERADSASIGGGASAALFRLPNQVVDTRKHEDVTNVDDGSIEFPVVSSSKPSAKKRKLEDRSGLADGTSTEPKRRRKKPATPKGTEVQSLTQDKTKDEQRSRVMKAVWAKRQAAGTNGRCGGAPVDKVAIENSKVMAKAPTVNNILNGPTKLKGKKPLPVLE